MVPSSAETGETRKSRDTSSPPPSGDRNVNDGLRIGSDEHNGDGIARDVRERQIERAVGDVDVLAAENAGHVVVGELPRRHGAVVEHHAGKRPDAGRGHRAARREQGQSENQDMSDCAHGSLLEHPDRRGGPPSRPSHRYRRFTRRYPDRHKLVISIASGAATNGRIRRLRYLCRSSCQRTSSGFSSTFGKSRLTTTGSWPLRTRTHDSGSSSRALISWCGTNGGM